jgi:hypothetical protein
MRGKILALTIILLMIAGSFGAVGTTIGTSKTFDSNGTQKIENDLIVSAGILNGNQKAVIVGGGIGLNYADDDAINMKALLIANGWSSSSITLLIDSQATKSAVTNNLNSMASGSTASSISLFFFSGHGTSDQNGEAICCYDSYLYDYEFNSILDNFNGKVVAVLDSCYSGGMPPSAVEGIIVDQFIANFIEGVSVGRGNENRVILMACAQDEYSYETGELQSGVFSYFLREGLNGPADEQGNNNGVITAEETFNYAQPKTTEYEPSQHPQIFDGDSGTEVPIIGIGGLSEMIFYGQDWDKDADGPDNPPIGDWQNDPPHAIRMGHEPFGPDATAWYMFDVGGNEVQEGMQVGIYFCDVGLWPFANGPSLYVYNWNSQSWTCLGENIADQDELVWQWKTTSNSNDYVDDNGLVWTKVYAESNDETILDTIGIRFELVPPPAPDLTCIGSLGWTDIAPGSTVTGSFTVKNIGEQGSNLNWEVSEWPDWGTWTFSPSNGNNLPKDGTTIVQVTVVAPDQGDQQFSGEVKVVNADDSNDYEIIPVSLATPVNQQSVQQINQDIKLVSPQSLTIFNNPYNNQLVRLVK